jgi:hypothetical protein
LVFATSLIWQKCHISDALVVSLLPNDRRFKET